MIEGRNRCGRCEAGERWNPHDDEKECSWWAQFIVPSIRPKAAGEYLCAEDAHQVNWNGSKGAPTDLPKRDGLPVRDLMATEHHRERNGHCRRKTKKEQLFHKIHYCRLTYGSVSHKMFGVNREAGTKPRLAGNVNRSPSRNLANCATGSSNLLLSLSALVSLPNPGADAPNRATWTASLAPQPAHPKHRQFFLSKIICLPARFDQEWRKRVMHHAGDAARQET
jgi:hypothetical protein